MKKSTIMGILAFVGITLSGSHQIMADVTPPPPGAKNDKVYNEDNGNVSGELYSRLFRSAVGYVNMWEPEYYDLSGLTGQYRLDSDKGEIYIYSPLSRYNGDFYIKGTVDNEGNVTVPCPQLVQVGPMEDDPQEMSMYVANCRYETTEYSFTYSPIEDNSDLHFDLAEDGTLTLCEGDVIGLFYWGQEYVYDEEYDDFMPVADSFVYVWTNDADLSQTMRIFSEEAPAPDKNLSVEKWMVACQQPNTYSPQFGAYNVEYIEACIDGDTFWVKGAVPGVSESWFKGEIIGEEVTFKTSYICYDEGNGYFYYLIPGRAYYSETGVVNENTGEVTLTFDAENKMLKGKDGDALFINTGNLGFLYSSRWINPVIKPVEEVAPARPMTPEFSCYYPMDGNDFAFFTFSASAMDINYNPLEVGAMYYEILIDGEPFVFTEDELGEIWSTEVQPGETFEYFPWDFYSDNLYKGRREFIFYPSFDGYATIGARTFYITEDGNYLYSDPLIYDVEEGVVGVEKVKMNGEDIVDTFFVGFDGVRIERPGKGIYLMTTVRADGTRQTRKVIRR